MDVGASIHLPKLAQLSALLSLVVLAGCSVEVASSPKPTVPPPVESDGLTAEVDSVHDVRRGVTCWVVRDRWSRRPAGVFCLSDSQLRDGGAP